MQGESSPRRLRSGKFRDVRPLASAARRTVRFRTPLQEESGTELSEVTTPGAMDVQQCSTRSRRPTLKLLESLSLMTYREAIQLDSDDDDGYAPDNLESNDVEGTEVAAALTEPQHSAAVALTERRSSTRPKKPSAKAQAAAQSKKPKGRQEPTKRQTVHGKARVQLWQLHLSVN
jgi:hypothetical protein